MQQDIPRRALEWLVENRKLNRKSLARVERESLQTGRPWEQLLLEAGELDRPTYLGAASTVTGLAPFNLQAQKISYTRAQMIPREVADQIPALPVALEDGQLVVVLQDPTDTFALERLATLTRLPVSPRVTYNPDLPGAIEKAFAVKVERIGAETPHGAEAAPSPRPEMKFATATRTPELDSRLRNSMVQKLGVSRTVKIDGFVTARPAAGEMRIETPQEKLEFLERNLIRMTDAGGFEKRLDTLLDSARTVCRADGASFAMLSPDRTELSFVRARGSRSEELMKVRLPLDEHSVAGYSVLHRQTLRVGDASLDPRQSKETDARLDYRTRSLVAAPVYWEGEPVGVLEVVNKADGTFTDEDVEFMQLLATQAALATTISHLSDQARAFRRETIEVFRDLLEHTGIQARSLGELVARVALALGREVELSSQELERLELAAYVHDLVQLQRGTGRDFLGQIQALADVGAVVRHRRTPYAGSGDPEEPSGQQIPRLSRILAMAVAWIEGLETRGLSGRKELLREILEAAGARFDPALKIPFEIAVNAVTPAGPAG